MTNGYERRINQRKELFDYYKDKNRWLRIAIEGIIQVGKVYGTELDTLYLKPSLIVEEREEGIVYVLEENDPISADMAKITYITPLKDDYVKFLLSWHKKEKSTAGFNSSKT